MPVVKFTRALSRFYPDLDQMELSVENLPGLLLKLDEKFPGLKDYIVDEQGALRKHVNIFIDGSLIKDRESLGDTFSNESEIFIMQALSGG